jgi:signal transduction histidine kinase
MLCRRNILDKNEKNISKTIKAVSHQAAKRSNVRELLNEIANKATKFLKCDSCSIWLYDEDKERLMLRGASGRHKTGIDIHYYKKGDGLHWHIFKHKKPYLLKKASDAKDIWKGKYVKKIYPDRVRTGGPFLGTPIIYKNNCIGALSFAKDDTQYEFTAENLEFAGIIADEIAISLDYISSHYDNEILIAIRKKRYLFISEFSRSLINCQTLEEIYKLTTETTMTELNCRTSSIFLFSKDGKLERKYIAGLEGVNVPPEVYERGQGLTGKTVGDPHKYGVPHVCDNIKNENVIQKDPKVKKYVENYEIAIKKTFGIDEEAKHVVTIPLNGKNRTFGVLRIINKIDHTTNKLSKDGIKGLEKDWLILISSIVATAVANIKKQEKINSISRINELLSTKKEEEIFDSLADIITNNNTPFIACIIRTLDEKRTCLNISGISGIELKKDELILGINQGIVGKAFLTGKYCEIRNIAKSKKFVNKIWAAKNNLVSMLCFPLKNVKNSNFGTLSVYVKYEYIFDLIDIDYLSRFAEQVSSVIQIIQEKRELRFINDISEQINKKNDVKGILDIAVCKIPNITGFDVCAIVKRKKDSYSIIASSHKGLIDAKISEGNPLVMEMKRSKKILVFHDLGNNHILKEFREILKNTKSFVLIPIVTANKKLYGTIVLIELMGRVLDTKSNSKNRLYGNVIGQLNRNLYETLASQIAIAVEKNKLLDSLRADYRRKDAINHIIQKISLEENLEKNLETILYKVVEILRAEIGYIVLLNKHSKTVKPTSYYGIKEKNFPSLEIDSKSLIGWVYENKEALLWPSGKESIDSLKIPFKGTKQDAETEIIAPLLYRNEIIGIIGIGKYEAMSLFERDKLFLKTVGDQIAVIIQNKKFHMATEKLAEICFDDKSVRKNCDIIARNATQIFENSTSCVWLKENRGGKNLLIMESWYGVEIKNRVEFEMPEEEGGISWETVRNKKENIIPEQLENPKHNFKHPSFIKENKLESMISVPIIVVNDVIGVLNSYSRRGYKYLDKEVYLLKNLATRGAIAIKSAKLTMQMEDINEKILDSAQIANPGQVAMSFTHDARHTMHNINALISSLIHFLPENVRKSDEGKDVINSITNDTDYLRKLFDSLVSYAKVVKITYKATKLKDIFDDVYNMYEIRLSRNRISCSVNYEYKECKNTNIECNRNQIEQVLVNLYNNSIYAIKQKMKKGGLISIFVRNLDDENIEIQFKDNGSGISEENINKIFEPLFTTKGLDGSGYGLPICKRIIEDNHYGKISVKSKNNEYTIFFIKLPKRNS